MQKINKTYYWIFLLLLFGGILALRYFGFLSEIRKEFFYIIFGLLICLILLPLFGEIEFLGIKLKKELNDFKEEVKNDITSIKTEIKNSTNQQVYLNYDSPASDKRLAELEKEIESLKAKYKFEDKNAITPNTGFILPQGGLDLSFQVKEYITNFFSIRYTLENLIKDLWHKNQKQVNPNSTRVTSAIRMLFDLAQENIVDREIADITKEILSICNYIVHGENATKKQIEFVEKNSKLVYDYFIQLSND